MDVGVERGEVVKFHVNWGGWECGSVSGRRRLGYGNSGAMSHFISPRPRLPLLPGLY